MEDNFIPIAVKTVLVGMTIALTPFMVLKLMDISHHNYIEHIKELGMHSELKKCPFCGGEPVQEKPGKIRCVHCGIKTPEYGSMVEAVVH